MPEWLIVLTLIGTLAAAVTAAIEATRSRNPKAFRTSAFTGGMLAAAISALMIPGYIPGPEPDLPEQTAEAAPAASPAPTTTMPGPTPPPAEPTPVQTVQPAPGRVHPTPRVPLDTTCDSALRSALETTHGTYGTNRIATIIKDIQEGREDCVQQYWNPVPMDADLSDMCGPLKPYQKDHVGGVAAPSILLRPTSFGAPRAGDTDSGGLTRYNTRTQWGHVMIHWTENDRPHDAAYCWLKNADSDTWGAE